MAPDFRLLAAAFLFVTLSSCDGNALHPEPDRAAPQVTLTAPAEGILLRDDSVRVTGTARDSAGAVTRVLYALGSGAEREVPVTPGREVSFAFTVTGLAPGSNTITVHAEDGRGNRGSQFVTVAFHPDRTPPEVTLTAPAEGILLRDDTVRVTGAARDSVSALTRVTYAVGTGPEREVSVTPGREVSFAFLVTALGVGSNAITVHATDERGNRGSQTVTVTYQPNRPPVARDDTASTWTDSTVVIRVLANDTDADGDSLRIEGVTSPAFGTVSVDSGATLTYTPGPARAGAVTFQYVVSDDRGATDTAQVTVRVRPDPRLGAYRATEVILPPVSAAGTVEGSTTRVLRLNNQGELLLSRHSTVRVGSAPGEVWTLEEHLVWEGGRTRNAVAPGSGPDPQRAYDINNLGQVLVGTCTQDPASPGICSGYSLVVLSPSGARRVLPYAGPEPWYALLNDAGQAATVRTLCSADRCTQLPGDFWGAAALNARGEVTGTVHRPGARPQYQYAVLYRGGELVDLGGGFTSATDLNDSTWVVGTFPTKVFLWRAGTLTLIPAPEPTSFPTVNNRGQIAFGTSLWEGGRTFPLNAHVTDSTWEVVSTHDINDAGQIAVRGRNRNTGAPAILILTPER